MTAPIRRTLGAPVTVGVLLLASLAAPAGARVTDGDIQVLDVSEESDGRVWLEIAVPPAIGQLAPVAGNFGLTEDGRLVDVEVEPITTAVEAIVVIDTSGSMRGAPLRAARAAASSFLDQLPEEARVGVIGFGAEASVEAEPTADKAAVLAAVDGLAADGETALWDGLALAADLARGLDTDRPYVIVLSDGDDTVSALDRSAAVARLRAAGAGLYAIAIDTPDTDRAALDGAVAEVGGQFLTTDDIEELDALYTDVAARLASRYRLSFTPQTTGRRTIVVSVAADGAVATAKTVLDHSPSPSTRTSPDGGPPPVLNVPGDALLGPLPTPDPGLFGTPTMLLIGLAAMFGAFLMVGLLVAIPVSEIRLGATTRASRRGGFGNRVGETADRLVAKRDTEGELDAALDAAGIDLRPGEFVLLATLGVVTVALLASVTGGPAVGLLLAAASAAAVVILVSVRISRRRSAFADQLTDALSIMNGSLRAGRGLPQALELVATEAPSPTSEEFRRIVFETRVGRDLTTAMLAAAGRMKSQDLEWVTRAVAINRELGGDLTEVLDNVADTIRSRQRVTRQVRALSAEGRASGWVLLALPVLMFLFLLVQAPDSAYQLTGTALGRVMLAVAAVGMVAGYLWIRKLIKLEY